jgi:hypothetical protein
MASRTRPAAPPAGDRRVRSTVAGLESLGAPVQQPDRRAVRRVHDVVRQAADVRRAGDADRHVEDFAAESRGAGQLRCAAGKDQTRRQHPLARRSDLGGHHLEGLAHAGLDDPADVQSG